MVEYIKKNSNYFWLPQKELKTKFSSWSNAQKWIISKSIASLKYENLDPIDNSLLAIVEQLQRSKNEGNLVIFVGAGISKSSGIPLWGELIDGLKKGISTEEEDFEIIPQLYFQEHGEVNYYKKIKELLNIERAVPNCIHSELFHLNPDQIITTNYDRLLEQESENLGKNYFTVFKDIDLPMSSSSSLIIKMHGDLESKNIVLKEDDYLLYSEKFPLIENLVKSVFASKTILFVGFSFGDRNLKRIIESVRHILKEGYNPAVLFNPSNNRDIDKNRIQYFKNRGVNIVGFEPIMESYLTKRNIKIPCKDIGKDVRKSRTYQFLRFMREYSEEDQFLFNNEDIIDKMYRGLKRFSDLSSIPPKYIVKIKPFAYNDDTPAIYSSTNFRLQIESEDILKFLKKVECIDNEKIIYTNKETESDKKRNEGLFFVYRKLINSAVLGLQRKNDFKIDQTNPIVLKNSNEECDCPSCLFFRFEFEKVYQTGVLSNNLEDKDPYFLLKRAKVKFFFAEYESCFSDLKAAASTSRSNQQFHLYLICLYNIKLTEYRIKGLYVPSHIDKTTKESILEEISSLSLPSVIEGLYVNQLSKDILHSILKEELFHKTLQDLGENIKGLLNQSKRRKSDISLGPNYSIRLISSFRIYYNFVEVNHLFDIFYIDFRKLTAQFEMVLKNRT